MAEETSLKAPGPNRAIRVVVGVAAIGVLLAALAWMIPHFIAQPARATLTQETPMGMSSGYAPSMNVYDRKCLLSKKTLSLPAVTRRGLQDFDEFHCNSLRYAFCCALRQRFDPTPFACLQVSYRAKLVSESRFLHT